MDVVLPTNNLNIVVSGNESQPKLQLLRAVTKTYYKQIIFQNNLNIYSLPDNVAIITMEKYAETEFKSFFSVDSKHIINLNFDLISPLFSDEKYHLLFNSYIELLNTGECDIELANNFLVSKFNNIYHSFNFEDADRLVKFIDDNQNCDFYIFSDNITMVSAIIEYITDTYMNHSWQTNHSMLMPEEHIIKMLKLMYSYYELDFKKKPTYINVSALNTIVKYPFKKVERIRNMNNKIDIPNNVNKDDTTTSTKPEKSKRKRRNKDAE